MEQLLIREAARLSPEQKQAAQRLAKKFIPEVNTTEPCFAVLRRDRVVAALFGCVEKNRVTQEAAFQIDAIVVVPELRRAKLASALVQKLETSVFLQDMRKLHKFTKITGQVIHEGSMKLMANLGYTIKQENPTVCPTCSKSIAV